MPGRSVSEAIDAFVDPLRQALSCVGTGHLTLSPKARRDVGEPHTWVLNGGDRPVALGGDLGLRAMMGFEVQDRGSSQRDQRFKVRTRAYMYSIVIPGGELMCAHWHPGGLSDVEFPHWHFGSPVLSPTGVFLERAHIPSPRVSFEYFLRLAIETIPEVTPAKNDWDDRLARLESTFDKHKSWD